MHNQAIQHHNNVKSSTKEGRHTAAAARQIMHFSKYLATRISSLGNRRQATVAQLGWVGCNVCVMSRCCAYLLCPNEATGATICALCTMRGCRCQQRKCNSKGCHRGDARVCTCTCTAAKSRHRILFPRCLCILQMCVPPITRLLYFPPPLAHQAIRTCSRTLCFPTHPPLPN